ncbi:hypothetical protein [Bosea sp. (in: a-proteobacteria)]|uniref:hypothetical protein n=1 Tax=Bosea sp. (in: a-proteobacteria) TaxID=1871050 RepID=UPI00121462E7|nr:hypothetical protein [Bosea sp. (in: a-proteobacteria)]TAJ30208.1 MAG: hypothetical protein EPO59_13150 [Bosea sp. (in: a-proteobacteria)]
MSGKACDTLDIDTVPQPHEHAQVADLPLSALEVATFIESMTAELRLMARGVRLDTLCYFLEMARVEASIQIEQIAARPRA